jgi:hypothetical protein
MSGQILPAGFDPACSRCDTDTHVCPGCGANVPHGTVACAACNAESVVSRACDIRPAFPAAPVAQTSPLAEPPAKTVDLDDTTAASWYAALVEADDQIALWTGIRGRAIDHLQAAIGDAHEARINGRAVITWRESRPGKTLDRAGLEAAYGKDVIAGFLKDKKAARPFKRVEDGA